MTSESRDLWKDHNSLSQSGCLNPRSATPEARQLEAAEAAICRERTPIFNGTERLTIAERIRWLGDKQTNASELGAVDDALRGEMVAHS